MSTSDTMSFDFNISDYGSYDYNTTCFEYFNYEYSLEIESAFHLFCLVCSILIFCISVPGNIFLLWVLLRERAWTTTPDILQLQLTISDLCSTLTLPFWACYLLYGCIFADWACKVLRVAFFLGLNSYALILTAMVLYRHLAMVYGSCLAAQATQRCRVLGVSILILLTCAVVSTRLSINSVAVNDRFSDIMCLRGSLTSRFLVVNFYKQIGLFFLTPVIIITFCCVRMWIKQRRINRRHQGSRLILGMLVVFFLCLVPYNVMLLLQSLMMACILDNTVEKRQAMYYAGFIINTLPYFRCCLNPLVRMFGAQRFRRRLPGPCKASPERRDGSPMASVPAHDNSVEQQTFVLV